MTKRFEVEPDTFVTSRWEVVEDDPPYWKGYTEGDKDGECLDLLLLYPEHNVGRIIVEKLHVCPQCGCQIFRDRVGWYCPSCD